MRPPPALLVLLACAPCPAAAPRPNIVLILADDLGYGDLSCYGQKHFQTPHLDRIAAEGVRFTDHYAGATVCAPSRCCLMTGLHGGHAGIRGNGPFELRPDPADVTVATLLQRAGYRTAMIGKSCVTGNTQTPATVLAKGFDVFYGTTSHKDGHFRFPRFVYDQADRLPLAGNTLHSGPHHDVDLYTARALRFIADTAGHQPFFLLLSYPAPHASLIAPEDALARVTIRDDVDYWPEQSHYSRVRNVKANYAALVTRLDDAAGRILELLERTGVGADTLVMFTSDNGPHSEGGYRPAMLASSGPLRGGKRDLHEGGIRVPLVARWPGGAAAGRVVDHPSAFWDFLPTACELAGVKPPDGLDGISYVAALTGRGAQARHDFLYWEFHELGGRRALRAGDWKLVQHGLEPGRFGAPQLFDLARDRGEQHDLAASRPELVRELLERMDRARVPDPRFRLPGLDQR